MITFNILSMTADLQESSVKVGLLPDLPPSPDAQPPSKTQKMMTPPETEVGKVVFLYDLCDISFTKQNTGIFIRYQSISKNFASWINEIKIITSYPFLNYFIPSIINTQVLH